MVAKVLEDAIIAAYCNYLLDPNCVNEAWPVFLYFLVDEFLAAGANMRTYKVTTPGKFGRTHKVSKSARPIPGSPGTLSIGLKCPGKLNFRCLKEIQPSARTKVCKFCGRQKAKYKCRGCNMTLCVTTPKGAYSKNGPCCFLRFHGITHFTKI